MRFRAFYRPANGKYKEDFVDAPTLEELPAGAILIILINDVDGTRQIIQDASKKRTLTTKESRYHKWAMRILEKKHDGGPTAEMIQYMKENR